MLPETLTQQVIDQRHVRLRIGVDMGGNDIKFGATNLEADRLLLAELIKRPSLTQEGPHKTVAQTIDGIQGVLSELEADWSDISDISVTVPCPCTPEGVIIEATNIGTAETKHLWKVPFGELLAKEVKRLSGFEIPVFACNDANAAGQDDDFVRFGLDRRPRTSLFITTGTGLGGCVILNGGVFFGRGQAGELGHVKPTIPAAYAARFRDDPHPACGCSAHDCTETRASLQGLVRRIRWALSEAGAEFIRADLASRGEPLNEAVLAQLRELLEEGPRRAAYQVRTFADRDRDPFCRWLLEDWAIMIGALFASLAPAFHPDLCIIGGGLTEMSAETRNWFIGVARRVYSEINGQSPFDTAPGNCEIVWSVSQDQGWRGAILMGIRSRQVMSR